MARKTNNKNGNETQKFSITAPTAVSVQLAGCFTQWQKQPIDLRRIEGGHWHTTVKLEPGNYHYRFLVDGQWQDDPECMVRVPNPYGNQDSVRQVGACASGPRGGLRATSGESKLHDAGDQY